MQAKSTLVDAGSSPTSVLRAGLVLGKVKATGLLEKYDPTATDGTQVAFCVLAQGISMLDSAGSAQQKQVHVLWKGILQADQLLLLDNMARKQLLRSGRYLFDEAHSATAANSVALAGDLHLSEVAKAGPTYTVVAADAGTLFVAGGACNFTLPTIAAGLGPFEFLNAADADMVITSAAGDDILADGNAAADTVTFSTSSHKIGSRARIRANAAGTLWLFENLGGTTATVAG